MAKLKMSFDKLTVPLQIERARQIINSMTGNVNFATPNPTLAEVTTANNALETAFNESRNRDKNKIASMRLRRTELLFLITQLAAYVQEASGGNEEKIRSSGFGVRRANTPKPVVAGEVTNVRLKDGSNSGSIVVDWDKASDAIIYIISVRTEGEPEPVGFKGVTTKTQKEIDGLTPGKNYLVTVRALGREEAGPVSDPAYIIAR